MIRTLAMALIASAALISPAIRASGRLPDMPLPPQAFASFGKCLAELERQHADDLKGADAQPRPIDGGGTTRQVFTGEGVKRLGARTASYDGEIGWVNTSPVGDQIQSNYNWERHHLECDGKTLTGVNSAGYSLPSYTPAVTNKAAP